MPAVIRKSGRLRLTEQRREIIQAVGWQVRSTIWSPPADLYETDEAYVVRAEIAGMRDAEIEITFENNILIISAMRSDSAERRAYHQMEIRFGRFLTAIGLPGPVDVDRAEAIYDDGFLVVTLPKLSSGLNRPLR